MKTSNGAHILYVITKSNFGGAQRYVYDLAVAAKGDGHDVAVVTGGRGLLTERLEDAGVRVIPLASLVQKRSLLGDLATFGSLFSLIAVMRRERPALVHVNSAKAGGLGGLAARLTGVPHIVFTAHGWEFRGERSGMTKALIKLFSWLTIILADKTIAVSQAVHDSVVRWPFVKRRLFVIKNGIEDFVVLPREKARAELLAHCPALKSAFADPRAFVIGTLAELTPIKGLVYGLHALDALSAERRAHTYWVICGEGNERARLERLIATMGLEEHVFLAGSIPEARSLLKAFDLFLFPSLFEALGYVVLEAGHAGLPVVASRTGGIPEIIEKDAYGALVETRDSFGIARTLEELAASHETRTAMAHALKERVDSEFTRDEMVRATFALYASRR